MERRGDRRFCVFCVPIRPQAELLWALDQEQADHWQNDTPHQQPERHIRPAPAPVNDHIRHQRRREHTSDEHPNAHEAQGQSPLPYEPAGNRRRVGNGREPDPAKGSKDIQRVEVPDRGGEEYEREKPAAKQQGGTQDDFARAKSVGKQPNCWRCERSKARDNRKPQGDGTTAPAKRLGQGFDENAKRAGDEDRTPRQSNGRDQHHPPAVENPRRHKATSHSALCVIEK